MFGFHRPSYLINDHRGESVESLSCKYDYNTEGRQKAGGIFKAFYYTARKFPLTRIFITFKWSKLDCENSL